MKVLEYCENEVITLDSEMIKAAKEIKSLNPDLPFTINNQRLVFNEYTVGSILLLDTLINIKPRNDVFDLKKIFEMILFNHGIFNDNSSYEYDYSDSGIDVVFTYFLSHCRKLVNFGLTGGFKVYEECSNTIKGEIVFEKFLEKNIPIKGIYYKKQEYTLNIPANQIIKKALVKLSRSIHSHSSYDLGTILRNFDEIDEYNGTYLDYISNHKYFFSSNPYYSETIDIAITILKDMKLSFSNGQLKGYSFLHNSNDLFEEFVRKIVQQVSNINAVKWDIPKSYASISYHDKTSEKKYCPDIVVGYDPSRETAHVVLDVKNKHFNPECGNISDLISSPDMYQILFYCRKLKCALGGLIYPSGQSFSPVSVVVNDEKDLRLVLFSLNMNLPLPKRMEKLKKELYEFLYNYI